MKKTIQGLKGQSEKELQTKVTKMREDIAKLKLDSKVNPAKDTNTIGKKKRDLAGLLTVLNQKRITKS